MKISSGEEIYKYFIGYLYDDYKVKPLRKMLPKARTYVRTYDSQTKWMYFLIENFRIKSTLILKKNLIASLSTIKKFLKPK